MTTKGVSKHCSILNYIRRSDEEFYEIIQDLCLGRMFLPKRSSPGLTFLYPDKDLLNEIKKVAYGDEPEKAIEMIQSLVLLDNIPSIKEFGNKKSDIPTFLRKKLPVKDVDGNKVILDNGGEIVLDKNFSMRADREGLAVYTLSKKLVPADGPAADFSNVTKKSAVKKGGADLTVGNNNRLALFNSIVLDYVNSNCDPAMEMLVAMHNWATSCTNSQVPDDVRQHIADLIECQASYDTLATLAIVLQPYKTTKTYIDDETYVSMVTDIMGSSGADFSTKPYFTIDKDAAGKYAKLVACDKYKGVYDKVKQIIDDSNVVDSANKHNISKVITTIADKINSGDLRNLLCHLRKMQSLSDIIAEAELRVVSATTLEYVGSNGEHATSMLDTLSSLYARYTLNEPVLCNTTLVSSMPSSYFHSIAFMLIKSDALLYVSGGHGDAITRDNRFSDSLHLSLSKTLESFNESRRKNSTARIVNPMMPAF